MLGLGQEVNNKLPRLTSTVPEQEKSETTIQWPNVTETLADIKQKFVVLHHVRNAIHGMNHIS